RADRTNAGSSAEGGLLADRAGERDLARAERPGGERLRAPVGARLLEGGDALLLLQREPDVVEALHEAPARVVVDLEGDGDVAGGRGARLEVDGDGRAGLRLEDLEQHLGVLGGELAGHE